jgi:hypothetical protein
MKPSSIQVDLNSAKSKPQGVPIDSHLLSIFGALGWIPIEESKDFNINVDLSIDNDSGSSNRFQDKSSLKDGGSININIDDNG